MNAYEFNATVGTENPKSLTGITASECEERAKNEVIGAFFSRYGVLPDDIAIQDSTERVLHVAEMVKSA